MAAFALLLAACAVARRATEPVHLVILHTNDVHGQVLPRPAPSAGPALAGGAALPAIGGLTRLAACVDRLREEARREGGHALLVDAGDWYQGTPEGALQTGLPFVRALAELDYDAACPGNHEFDHGAANLRALLEVFGERAVAANLLRAPGAERVDWIKPWRIVRSGGLRIAFVGLLTPATPSITHPDARQFTFEDPAVAVARARQELAGKVDLLIPVGHIDLIEGEALAHAHPDLPLVVTGHSHTFLREERRVGNVLLAQAGARAEALGRVDLWFDPRAGRVVRSRSQLVDLDRDEPPSARSQRVAAACQALAAQSAALMDQVVGELARPLSRGRGARSTVAGNWVADLLRTRSGADVAVHNRGGTRTDLPAGPVTRRDLYELLPFDNWIVTQTLTGAELQELVRAAVEGQAHSGLDYSGLSVRVAQLDGRPRFMGTTIGGRPLDPDATYRVTTNSFLAGGGDGYSAFAKRRECSEDPLLLRDLALLAFEGGSRVVPPEEERIVPVEGQR
jgi:2',3'-cyclic-nucleotide 2'-phosphodiesterase (5'-nucleotidase family)